MRSHPFGEHFVTTMLTATLTVGLFAPGLAQAADDEKTIRLFNGKDLEGWTPYLWNPRAREEDKDTRPEVVWKVEDGVLVCAGRPVGYLRSDIEYQNYTLQLEWRWPEGTSTGNSGVLVHVTTPEALGLWPKSIEVQLYTRNAGDFWVIGTTLDVPNVEERRRGRRHLNLTDDSEKPIGEWNKMQVICRGNEILVFVNGELVNHATNCSVVKGAIALQSEGREIHFRNIEIAPLEG